MRMDLHGMRTRDAIEYFIREYNSGLSKGIDRMEVVHGYGSTGVGGDIRKALWALLDAHPNKVMYIKGESLGNKGITVVVPYGSLPSRRASVEAAVFAAIPAGKPVTASAVEESLSGLGTYEEISSFLSEMAAKGRIMKTQQSGRYMYTRK